jgi:hypothetical protein
MKSIFTILFFVLLTLSISAQKKKFLSNLKDEKTFNLAQDLYDDEKFEFALKQFKKLEVDFPSEPILLYRLGVCHLYDKGNKEIAYEYLSKVDKKKFSKSDFVYRLAQAQAIVGKYDEAIINANEALTKKIEPKKIEGAKLLIKQIEIAKSMSTNSNYTVKNAGENINTKYNESQATINSEGNYLLFAYAGEKSVGGLQAQPGEKNNDGIYYSDIYLSLKQANGNWSNAKVYDSLLATNGAEYPLFLSNDGMRMLSGKQESYMNYSVSVNKKDSTSWSLLGELSGLINTSGYENGAALFSSNNKIIFSSDRLGGYGGKDLYSAELMEDSTWGRIKNLGLSVNTADDEDFPHIHSDGKTLHFSSNGAKSMGGFDIFMSEYSPDEDTWGQAINMGMPINSSQDDIQFQVDGTGKTAYFSSGRSGGMGGSDIYIVSGLNYKSDPKTEKRETERLAAIQKRMEDSLANAKQVAAQQLALTERKALETNNEEKTISKTTTLAQQAEADKLAKAEAKRVAFENAKAEKEAKRIEKIAKEEAAKLAREEALEAKRAEKSAISGWDWSKYDLSSESAIAAAFGDITTENLIYKVQIASGTLPENISNTINTELGQIEELTIKGNKKYVIDKSFNTINEAFQLKNKVIEKGISDAFITGFYNGKRFYLIDLVKKGMLRK